MRITNPPSLAVFVRAALCTVCSVLVLTYSPIAVGQVNGIERPSPAPTSKFQQFQSKLKNNLLRLAGKTPRPSTTSDQAPQPNSNPYPQVSSQDQYWQSTHPYQTPNRDMIAPRKDHATATHAPPHQYNRSTYSSPVQPAGYVAPQTEPAPAEYGQSQLPSSPVPQYVPEPQAQEPVSPYNSYSYQQSTAQYDHNHNALRNHPTNAHPTQHFSSPLAGRMVHSRMLNTPASATEQLIELQQKYERLERRHFALQGEYERSQTRLAASRQELTDVQQAIEDASLQLKLAREKNQQLQSLVNDLRNESNMTRQHAATTLENIQRQLDAVLIKELKN